MKTFSVKNNGKNYLIKAKSEASLKRRLGKALWTMGAKIKEVKNG